MATKIKKRSSKSARQMRRDTELRSENRKWMGSVAGAHRRVKTKNKRHRCGPPGTSQGQHKVYTDKETLEGAVCVCGSCNRGFSRVRK